MIRGIITRKGQVIWQFVPPAKWWQRWLGRVRRWLVRGFWLFVAFELGRVWEMVSG